jgi:hypothetical protein
MSEELLDKYVDRASIADDTKFLTDQLKTVLDLFEKVNATKLQLNVATTLKETTEAAKNSKKAMDDLTAGKEKLITVDLEMIKTIKEELKAGRELNENYQELVKASVKNEIVGKALREQRAALNKDFKAGVITNEQYIQSLEDIKEAENTLKVSNLELGRAMRNMEKEAQAAEGSLNQLRAQLNQALQAFDALSAEEKKSETGGALKQKIVEITEAVTAEEEATKRFQRNVGNYHGSAKIIVDALEKAKQKFNELSQAADASPAALNDARRAVESLRGITDDKQFLSFSSQVGGAQKEVKAFTRVLIDLETRGEGNSKVAIDLRKHLAELTDQIADVKGEVKALASDTRSFDLFAGAVNFAADTFQTFAGVMALGTDNEKEAQEALKTLVAIQTISNGVKGIANELTTKGTAANRVYAFSQRQVALVMDETAAAGTRLKAALITIGIGALIIGIGLLIANFDKIKRAITGVSKEQEAYNKILKESDSEFTQAVKLVNQLKTSIDLAKKGFIDKEAVIKEYNDSIGKTTGQVKSLEQAEKELTEKGEAYIQMTLAKAVANLALEEAAKKAFEIEQKRQKQAEEFLTGGDKLVQISTRSGSAAPGGFVPSNNDLEKEKELRKIQSEKRKQAAIKTSQDEEKVFLDIANNAQKRAAEIAKKFKLNFYGDDKAVQQSGQTIKFRDGVLKADADLYKKLSESQDAYLITRISAREKANEIENQILNGQREAEFKNLDAQIAIERQKASIGELSKQELAQKEKELAVKKTEINKDYAEKQILLTRDLNRDLINIRQTSLIRQRELEQADIKLTEEGLKELQDKELKAAQERIKSRQDQDSLNQAEELRSLNALYEKKLINEREYQDRRFKIEKYYSLKAQTDLIKDAQKLIREAKENGRNTLELERNIADAKKAIDDELTARLLDNREKLKQKEKEVASLIITGINDLVTGVYDKQKNAVQEQIEQLDVKRQSEVDAVNASILSEQDKAAKIANINAGAQIDKEKLQKKQRDLDIKKAQFDKIIGILKVGIDTKQAVSSLTVKAAQAKAEAALLASNPLTAAYAPIAVASAAAILAQIPLAIASGAIQAGLIAAQPIPKFKHGRDDGPATWAIVGDGGKKEVVASSDLSQAYVTPNKDTLTYLPAGYKVFPDVDAFQNAAVNMVHKPLQAMPIIQNSNNDGLVHAMAYEIRSLKSALFNLPVHAWYMKDGDLKQGIKKGNSWDRYIQNNI